MHRSRKVADAVALIAGTDRWGDRCQSSRLRVRDAGIGRQARRAQEAGSLARRIVNQRLPLRSLHSHALVGWLAIRTSKNIWCQQMQGKAKHTYKDKDCRQKRCNIRASTQTRFEGFAIVVVKTVNEERASAKFEVRRITAITDSGCVDKPDVTCWASGSFQSKSGRDEEK